MGILIMLQNYSTQSKIFNFLIQKQKKNVINPVSVQHLSKQYFFLGKN